MVPAPPARSREDLRCTLTDITDLLFQPFRTARFEALLAQSCTDLNSSAFFPWAHKNLIVTSSGTSVKELLRAPAASTEVKMETEGVSGGKGIQCAYGKPYRVVSGIGTSFNRFLIVYFP